MARHLSFSLGDKVGEHATLAHRQERAPEHLVVAAAVADLIVQVFARLALGLAILVGHLHVRYGHDTLGTQGILGEVPARRVRLLMRVIVDPEDLVRLETELDRVLGLKVGERVGRHRLHSVRVRQPVSMMGHTCLRCAVAKLSTGRNIFSVNGVLPVWPRVWFGLAWLSICLSKFMMLFSTRSSSEPRSGP